MTDTGHARDTEIAELYGAQLGAYLELLDVPDSFKAIIVELLPTLSLEQIDGLKQNIEEQVAMQLAVESDPKFQSQVTEINNDTNAQLDEIISTVQ